MNPRKITTLSLYGIIFLLPVTTRHIFNFASIESLEGFREYTTWSLYALDFLFMSLLLSHIISIWRQLLNLKALMMKNAWLWIVALGFLLLAALYHNAINLYQLLRFAQAIIVYAIAVHLFKDEAIRKNSLWLLLGSGVIQSLIAIFQFMLQSSLGLSFLGESLISSQLWDVAKFEIGEKKLLRGYGTLAHSNLLGAFLLFSFAAGISLLHSMKEKFNDLIRIQLLLLSLVIIATGILITFSRSIWLVTCLYLLFSLGMMGKNITLLLHERKLPKIILLILGGIVLLATFTLVAPRLCLKDCNPHDKSFEFRSIYNKVSFALIADNPLLGIGPGTFVPTLRSEPWATRFSLRPWEMQPVHNYYLLLMTELGIIGFSLFLFFIVSKIFAEPKKTLLPMGLLFISFLILGLFDHYFWTIPQGQLIFWLSLAFSRSSSRMK